MAKTKDVTNQLVDTELVFDLKYKATPIEIVGKEAIEQAISEATKKYANYVVTEESFKSDKQIRANFNKLAESLKTDVKKKLKSYTEPVNEVNDWVKKQINSIEEVSKKIDEDIKGFEKKAFEDRKETVKKAFKDEIAASGVDIDERIFYSEIDDIAYRLENFMADNVRINKKNLDKIHNRVYEEVQNKKEAEEAIVKISEVAGNAGFSAERFIQSFKKGTPLADVIQAIMDDKAFEDIKKQQEAEEEQKRQKLETDIQEIEELAGREGIDPQKYIDLLKSGRAKSEVQSMLVDDILEVKRQKDEESRVEEQVVEKAQPTPEDVQEKPVRSRQVKKVGWTFNVDLTFFGETKAEANRLKDEFKAWCAEHGVIAKGNGKSKKVEMK